MLDAKKIASEVLKTEAQALHYLSENLPHDFEAVVALLRNTQGRVIVSGMGKSGHIGGKIAATLSSTGTPAQFVHPAEASHGDLGMVTVEDVCILLSNSGETAELKDIIGHCLRFNIPIVGISSNPNSTLMKAASYQLTLPKLPEACGIGMVPTTSTTLTLAIGDALSVALLRMRAFSAEDFSVFHPGGKLGAKMARVKDFMHSGEKLPCVHVTAKMHDALLEMSAKGFGVTAVIDKDILRGIITDGDLRRNMDGLLNKTAEETCTRHPLTTTPQTFAASALALMQEKKITALFVVEDNKPVGILHIHDLLRAGVA